ncbi:putative polyketide synthase protein [Thozetella sp. PMI_491]|nr:putative polyketide synthase protein [Thozetella sp. PMI_491]
MESQETPNPALTTASAEGPLSGPQESLLITLYAKRQDFRSPKPLLGDKWAADVFEKMGDIQDIETRLKGTPVSITSVTVRARCLDNWIVEFLAAHPTATVLHLACGLDTRALRLQDQCGSGVRWIDLDLPDVVKLRRRLAMPPPENVGEYTLVGASATDQGWLEDIPADRPTVVVFEGLTMYLALEDGKAMIQRLVSYFPSGQLLFDSMSPLSLKVLNGYLYWKGNWNFRFHWGVGNPKDVETFHDRIKLMDVVSMYHGPGTEELPLQGRVFFYVMSWVPYLSHFFIYLRYKF